MLYMCGGSNVWSSDVIIGTSVDLKRYYKKAIRSTAANVGIFLERYCAQTAKKRYITCFNYYAHALPSGKNKFS
jgi:hypothetical protein